MRLGAYEVAAQIGEGGMGQVFRATDTRLKRQVAIKILPPELAADRDRLARFQREAEVLASLNHPHIAGIYGLEESGGVSALVMELVDGEDLSQRIARGVIPLDEAIPIAKQIAEALEAAHEQGIVHRDLKPANIKVREDGTVKVLDFGLAKAAEPAAGSPSNLSMSPTITSPAMTQAGMILGTAAYMSPEQAKGRGADRRSDIWAFGCVLYEMLTGKRPFEGEDVSDTLAAILRGEPDWSRLPPDTPAAVAALIKGSLEKDRRRRIGDIAAALFVLRDPSHGTSVPRREPASARRRIAAIAAATIAAVGIAAGAWWVGTRSVAAEPKLVTRFDAPLLGSDEQFAFLGSKVVALSPDGRHVAYLTTRRLSVRSLDRVEPVTLRIHNTTLPDNIRTVFFSPDSQWIGFWQDGQIRKIGVGGGTPVTIAAARNPSAFSWESDGTIVYAEQGQILRVAEAQGTPEVLVPDLKGRVQSLQLLPGNRSILYTLLPAGSISRTEINVRSLETGEQTTVLRNGVDARYVPTGHLVYFDAGTLLAVPFDLRRLAVNGAPVPVAETIASSSFADRALIAGHFAISQSGTLAYISGLNVSETRTMVWVDRSGREEPLAAGERAFAVPRLSPDGGRIALTLNDQDRDIWIWDIGRKHLGRLTSDSAPERNSLWTPDGKRIAFGSTRGGEAGIWWQAADGSGVPERLAGFPRDRFTNLVPTTISPDGSRLVASAIGTGASAQADLWALNLTGDPQPAALLQTEFAERNAEISPNGQWLAYESFENDRVEIWVRPFPDVNGGKWPVSNGVGSQPLWARNGKELFFIDASGALMSVAVEGQSHPVFGTAAKVLNKSYVWSIPTFAGRQYDISPDGQRFLMFKGRSNESSTVGSVTIVQNWFEELKRLVPVQ
jgi:serine/threonine-protein kinase